MTESTNKKTNYYDLSIHEKLAVKKYMDSHREVFKHAFMEILLNTVYRMGEIYWPLKF